MDQWRNKNITNSFHRLFLTTVIDYNEGWDMPVVDLLVSFLPTDVEDVTMLLGGWLAKLMVTMAPQVYCKYVTVNAKGTKISLVKMQKAL